MSNFTVLEPDKLSNYPYKTLSDRVEILRFNVRKKIEKVQEVSWYQLHPEVFVMAPIFVISVKNFWK
ncbi:MAG: hypothetical protein AAF378_12415 [Cyanobacteria bacterium P01_A01_bin.84]